MLTGTNVFRVLERVGLVLALFFVTLVILGLAGCGPRRAFDDSPQFWGGVSKSYEEIREQK